MTHHAVKLDEPSEVASETLSEISLIIHTAASVIDPEEEGKETKQMLRYWYTWDTHYEKTAVFVEVRAIICAGIFNSQIKAEADLHGIKKPKRARRLLERVFFI